MTTRDSFNQQVASVLGAGALLAIALALHYTEASSAAWTADDGHLLYAAATISPAKTFFIPNYTREASPNGFVTPLLPFVYFVNTSLFGLSPARHYASMFVGIVLATCAVYGCARLWLPRAFAFMAAAIFLAGRPTLLTSASLANSHYLWGAVLTLFATFFFVRHLRNSRGLHLLLAIAFWSAAATAKELYVLVPVLWLLIPEPSVAPRRRLLAISPALMLLPAYFAWRYQVLGELVGGYQRGDYHPLSLLHNLSPLKDHLLGDNTVAVGAILIATLGRSILRRRVRLAFLMISTGVLLGPVLALAGTRQIEADRYLLLIWIFLAIGVPWLLHSELPRNLALAASCALAGLLLLNTSGAKRRLMEFPDDNRKLFAFLAQADERLVVVTSRQRTLNSGNKFGAAFKKKLGRTLPTVVWGEQNFELPGRQVIHWNAKPDASAASEQLPIEISIFRSNMDLGIRAILPRGTARIIWEQETNTYLARPLRNSADRNERLSKIFWPDGSACFRFFVSHTAEEGSDYVSGWSIYDPKDGQRTYQLIGSRRIRSRPDLCAGAH